MTTTLLVAVGAAALGLAGGLWAYLRRHASGVFAPPRYEAPAHTDEPAGSAEESSAPAALPRPAEVPRPAEAPRSAEPQRPAGGPPLVAGPPSEWPAQASEPERSSPARAGPPARSLPAEEPQAPPSPARPYPSQIPATCPRSPPSQIPSCPPPDEAWTSEPQPEPAPARYANVVLRDAGGARPVIVPLGSAVRLDIVIGALHPESDVRRPEPLPEDLLPQEDLRLDVSLTSAELAVATLADDPAWGPSAEQSLLLPFGGGPARTEAGDTVLRFAVRLPDRSGLFLARLSYLHRSVIVQSQRVELTILEGTGQMCAVRADVATDFTLSEQLGADLADLAPRERVSIVAQQGAGDLHHVAVRSGDAGGAPLADAVAFTLRTAAFGKLIDRLRDELKTIAPTTRQRKPKQLIDDLRRLAPLGHQCYSALPGDLIAAVLPASDADVATVLEVVLPEGTSFTVPWSFVYDIHLDSEVQPAKVPICPLVADWDGVAPMVEPGTRSCPRARDVDHTENLLCPFGFWGFRYSVEVLTSADRPRATVSIPAASRFVIAETEQNVDRRRLAEHVEALRGILGKGLPGVEVVEARSKSDVRREIEADLPFVYFLCHGEHTDDAGSTVLAVGRGERISPADVKGWIDVALRRDKRRLWDDPQPFIFINACESLAIRANDMVDYLDAFVGRGHAVGVVGTEVRVHQTLAMELAEAFYTAFAGEGAPLDEALQRVKTGFLASGNLVGLVYTPYALADLRVDARPRNEESPASAGLS